MKKKLGFFLALVMMVVALTAVLTVPSSAATSGSCGSGTLSSAKWSYSNGTLTINGGYSFSNVQMYDYSLNNPAPWMEHAASITTVKVEGYLINVGDYAFAGLTALKTVTISGTKITSIGDHAFYGCTSLSSVSITSPVTSIGNSAFSGCTSLSSITIPASVTKLGGKAFYGASSLTTVNLGSGLTAIGAFTFEGCHKLTSVTIPANVTTIENRAFYGATALKSVTFASGSKLSNIGTSAFEGCSNLLHVALPATVKQIGNRAFYSCQALTSVTIASGSVLEKIGTDAFRACPSLYYVSNGSSLALARDSRENGYVAYYAKLIKKANGSYDADANFTVSDSYLVELLEDNTYRLWAYLGTSESLTLPATIAGKSYQPYYMRGIRSVTLSSSMTKLGASAFMGNTILSSITIPASVTSIDRYAFYGCTALTSVSYASGAKVASIGEAAFRGCDALTSVHIPASVTSIGKNAFASTSAVTAITADSANTVYTAVGNCLVEKATGTVVLGCKNSTIPTDGSVVRVGESAFFGCADLSSVSLPASVTTIEPMAFYFCPGIKTVTFASADQLAIIGDASFAYCSGITSFTVPKSVRSIGARAFDACSSLTKLNISNISSWLAVDFASESSNPLSLGADLYVNGVLTTSVIIPADATVINKYSLSVYDGLASLSVASGNGVFKGVGNSVVDKSTGILVLGCKNSTISANGSVTGIGDYAFYGCEDLLSLNIPSTVVSIGKHAFDQSGCYYNAVNWDNGVLYLGNYLIEATDANLYGDYTVRDGIVGIAGSAFCGNDTLTGVILPTTLAWIDDEAFAFAGKLGNVTFAKSGAISRIGYGAFASCNALTELTIPASVTSIGDGAFAGCSSLKNLLVAPGNTAYANIPHNGIVRLSDKALIYGQGNTILPTDGSVTSIGNYAFAGRSDLTGITIPTTIVSIGKYAFADCDNLLAITVPASVTSIGDGAFLSASSLARVSFKDGSKLASIGDYAFAYCSALKSITLPETLVSLGDYGFFACKSLSSVSFGINSTLEAIGESTFEGCAALKVVILPGTLKTVGESAFLGCTVTTVYFAGAEDTLASVTFADVYADPTRNATVIYAYTYTFLDHDGSIILSQKDWENSVITAPTAPEKPANYTFLGYAGFTEGMLLTENVTFTAEYDVNGTKYTYTFYDEDGVTVLKTLTIFEGSTIIAPEAPTKANTAQYTYTFAGFDGFTEGMTLTGDVSFVAKFNATVNQYTYVFYDENGTTVLKSVTADYGTAIVAPTNPTKAGNAQYSYTFTGFTGYESGMTLAESVTFVATYDETVNRYTYVFYDDDGTTVLKSVTADYGTAIVAPADPTKATTAQYTYTFAGFSGYTSGMFLTENVSFVALYDATINQYTYVFYDEDGTTVLKTVTADYGTAIVAPANPVKPNTAAYTYTFAGFSGYTSGMILTKNVSFLAVYNAVANAPIKIKSAKLELAQDIGVIYTASVPANYTNYYMVFTFCDVNYVVEGKAAGTDLYTFKFEGVLPQTMGENIKATLYATINGEVVTNTVETYSVRQYCVNQLNKTTDTGLITLLSDLLVYGAKAQLYRNYNVDNLVTKDIAKLAPSTFTTLDASASKKAVSGTKDPTAYWKSAGLVYENAMALYVNFVATDVENLTVEVLVEGRKEVYNVKDLTQANGVYTIHFSGIMATEFDTTVTANFYRDGVKVGQTMTYSVNSYVYTAQNSADTKLADLMKATYNYGASAYDYSK